MRVGNAASAQLQLDVYGEVLDALYQARVHGAPPDDNVWALQLEAARVARDGLAASRTRGSGRCAGRERHFTHSKVMAWVAFDRAVRSTRSSGARARSSAGERFATRSTPRCSSAPGATRSRPFAQSYGSDELDASLLLMPLVGFLPADDPRVVGTVDAIGRELTRGRARAALPPRGRRDVDGLPPGEGVFLPCSFWLADVLALQGACDEARELFERLLDLRNDVGLLAEEYDPVARRQLGNFPQAFTHLALVGAAIALGEGRSMRAPG